MICFVHIFVCPNLAAFEDFALLLVRVGFLCIGRHLQQLVRFFAVDLIKLIRQVDQWRILEKVGIGLATLKWQ